MTRPVVGFLTRYSGVGWRDSGWSTEGGAYVGCTTRGAPGSHPFGAGVTVFVQISRFDVDTGSHSLFWSAGCDLNNDVNATSGNIRIRDVCRINDRLYAVVHDGRRIDTGSGAIEFDVYVMCWNVLTGALLAQVYDGTALELLAADSGTLVAWSLAWCTEIRLDGTRKDFCAVTRRPTSGATKSEVGFYLDESGSTYTPDATPDSGRLTTDPLGFNDQLLNGRLFGYPSANGVAGIRYFYNEVTGAGGWWLIPGTSGFGEVNESASGAAAKLARGSGFPDYIVDNYYNVAGLWDPDTGGEVWTDETETVQATAGPTTITGSPSTVGFHVRGEQQVSKIATYDASVTVRRFDDSVTAWTSSIVLANGVAVLFNPKVTNDNPPNG